jgi:AcrR family transcriptional regulator
MPLDPERRQRRVHKRRAEILATAKDMFLIRPYSQVSVEEISAACDLSKATVYSYFTSKLDIYSAIIVGDAELLASRVRAVPDPKRSTLANLRAMARTYMDFFLAHPEYFGKLSWFYLPGRERHLPQTIVQEVRRHFAAVPEAIEGCLKHGMERGELNKVDTKAASMAVYSQWLGLTHLTIARSDPRLNHRKLADAACGLYVSGMLRARSKAEVR